MDDDIEVDPFANQALLESSRRAKAFIENERIKKEIECAIQREKEEEARANSYREGSSTWYVFSKTAIKIIVGFAVIEILLKGC